MDGHQRLERLTESNGLFQRDCEAQMLDPELYGSLATADRTDDTNVTVVVGSPDLVFLDLPLLRGDEAAAAGYVAAAQTPWPGALAVYGSPETSGYQLRAVIEAPALMGSLLTPLANGVVGVFDHANTIRVKINSGELTSTSRLQLFSGQNAAAIEVLAGVWEVLQFETAVLVDEATYQLSGLLRGQAGTDAVMAASVAVGARFVLLSGEITPVDLTNDEVGLAYHWRVGPQSRSLSDASYVSDVHDFKGIGLRPYAPVHAKGLEQNGDRILSWIRRTRSGGDSWDVNEVPLGETEEAYAVDILDGAAVKRTISTGTPQATYSVSDQFADFGSAQAHYNVAIYQVSPTFGRGSPLFAVI